MIVGDDTDLLIMMLSICMIDLDVFYRPYLEPDDENLLKVGTKLLIALYDVNSKDTDMEAMRLR